MNQGEGEKINNKLVRVTKKESLNKLKQKQRVIITATTENQRIIRLL